ncbi:MAG: Phosphate transport system permease protein PstA, partial [uncultured Nocardioidaceae bacterium]
DHDPDQARQAARRRHSRAGHRPEPRAQRGVPRVPGRALVLARLRRPGAAGPDREHGARRCAKARREPLHRVLLDPFRGGDRRPGRHPREPVADGDHGGDVRPAGNRRRPVPRGVRQPHPVVQPADRGQPAEPRGGSLGDLWPAGSRPAGAARVPADVPGDRRGTGADPADPAGHHHHHPGVDPCGPARDPGRLAGARRHVVADHLAPVAALGDPRHRDRDDPGAVPRDRRGRSPAAARRRHRYPVRPERDLEPVHRAADPDLHHVQPAPGGVPDGRGGCDHRAAGHDPRPERTRHLHPQPLPAPLV